MEKHPLFKNPIYDDMTGKQRKLLFELYKLYSGTGDCNPSVAAWLEGHSYQVMETGALYCTRAFCRTPLLGNPEWVQEFEGFKTVQLNMALWKDFYNRSLNELNKNKAWVYAFDLTPGER